MKKQNIIFLSGLLAFGILLACTKTPEQIAEKARNSTVRLVASKIGGEFVGSGFFVKRDQIVTNIHVVAGGNKITVRLVGQKTEYTIEGVVAFDAKNDLVILQIKEEGPTPLSLRDSEIRVNEPEPIVVVGNPGGKEGHVAYGTIHGTRSDKYLRLETGISEGGGSSGGPVLNSKGQVIGIVMGGTPHYIYAIPSTVLSKITLKNQKLQEIESLSDWQERPKIIAYRLLNSAREINNAMQLNNIDEERIKYLDSAIGGCTTAIKLYRELNLSRTFAADAYNLRGLLWYFRGAYDKAIKDFEKVFELIRDYDSSVYNHIGIVRCKLIKSTTNEQEAQRLYEEAVEDFDEAIRLNPEYIEAYYQMGLATVTLGQSVSDEQEAQRLYEKAVEDFDEAIRLNPDYVEAYYYRGIAKVKQGQSKFTLGQSKDDQKEKLSLYEAAVIDLDKAIMDLGKVIKQKRDYADIGQDEAIKQKQHYAVAYHSRGYMKLKFADFHKTEGNKEKAQRLYEEAIKDLDEAIRLGLKSNLKTDVQQMQKWEEQSLEAEESLEQLKK